MNFFSKFFTKRKSSKAAILNYGLRLTMVYGNERLESIKEKLLDNYKFLSAQSLMEYEQTCKNTNYIGQNFIFQTLDEFEQNGQQLVKSRELKDRFVIYMLEQYPWIKRNNLSKLYNYNYYHAIRDINTRAIR